MAAVWVQVCNEHLLPRFGVDRFLAMAGRHFAANGIEVSYACLRHDPSFLDETGPNVLQVRVPLGQDIGGTERLVTRTLLASWLVRRPDAILIGGWPFFDLAARAPSVGVPSVFIDAGAVPLDVLEGDPLWPQLELRRQRQAFLPSITRILPISKFIRDSQTLRDRGTAAGVTTVLLGADHLDVLSGPLIPGSVVEQVVALRRSGRKLLLNLGRFEAVGYKNSPQFFDVLAGIADAGIGVTGLILAEEREIDVPPRLREHVLCLGRISDTELQAVISLTHLGVSMSLWKSFNLPLVEMQHAGKPVLAFNLGAHPEVVAHPWQLCRDGRDMIARAAAVLGGHPPVPAGLQPALDAFATRLPWADTTRKWLDELRTALPERAPPGRRLLLIDVTISADDPANSGVVHVTRHLTRQLAEDPRFDVVFMRWRAEGNTYTTLSPESHLNSFGGPDDLLGPFAAGHPEDVRLDILLRGRDPACAGPVVALLPEVTLDGTMHRRRSWLRHRGLLVTSILYDLVPVNHPELCDPAVVAGFTGYLEVLRGFDQCIAISTTSLADLVSYAEQHGASLPLRHLSIWLPAQLGNLPRVVARPSSIAGEVRILCVSTLEPRKNHRRLLQAFGMLVARRPELNLRLVLVGNASAGDGGTLGHVQSAQANGMPVDWLGVVTDGELARQYARARFTVYPSLVEGFGLPILESLWMGRPAICNETGVMPKLAAPGGCLVADMLDPVAICLALDRLATDDDLHRTLTDGAMSRPLTTWREYGRNVGTAIAALASLDPISEPLPASAAGLMQDLFQARPSAAC